MKNYKTYLSYIGYLIVLLISFSLSWLLPVSETLKGALSFPGIGALFMVLYQIWRDDISHRRHIELQNKQQDFVLGTATHMADVVYDKHVIFCEEYIKRIQEILQELLRDGPTRNALNFGGDLVRIRFKHSAWLTPEIERSLEPFEMALIRMGANEGLLEHLPTGEKRTGVVNEIYNSLGLILGHDMPADDRGAEIAKDRVIEKIRNILGINVFTELRKKAGVTALERMG